MADKIYSLYDTHKPVLYCVLLVQTVALLPHFSHLPLEISAFFLFCVAWKISIIHFKFLQPNKLLLWILICLWTCYIIVKYKSIIGPEAGLSLLVIAFILKLLEAINSRDIHVVIIISLLVIGMELLYDTDMLVFLYLLLVSYVCVFALVILNRLERVEQSKWLQVELRGVWRKSISILLQSIPLTLILFIFFPRIDPIWNLKVKDKSQLSGLSESMSVSDFAQLGNLSKVVFRVQFKEQVPNQANLYWRGFTFTRFNGAEWYNPELTRHIKPASWKTNKHKAIFLDGVKTSYRVILEPTSQPYLFALEFPVIDDPRIGFTSDFGLLTKYPITQTFQYDVTSFLDSKAGVNFNSAQLQQFLLLPRHGNKRTHAVAQQWFQEVAKDQQQYVEYVLNWFNSQPYVYTLKPTRLSENIIDGFLFDTREGFCAHYASAFVFLMRAAGIPANVVVGYLGGEVNPMGQYSLIHQFEAHAWAEVWYPQKGWVRVDPTAAVAPERVLDGVEQALEAGEQFLAGSFFAPERLRKIPWLDRVRLSLDYINFAWNRWVVGYGPVLQERLYGFILQRISIYRIVQWVILLFVVVLLIKIVSAYRNHKNKDGLDQAYLEFCKRLSKQGLTRKLGETPEAFREKAVAQFPSWTSQVDMVTGIYLHLRYSCNNVQSSHLKKAIKVIRNTYQSMQN